MEALLDERSLIETRSVAASLGGSNDRGRGLSPKGRGLLEGSITRNGIALIAEKTLEESVDRRIEIYDREAGERGIRAYVNIGGGAASIGNSLNGTLIRAGINEGLPAYNWTRRGVLHHYARRGVPIVHVLRIETIAQRHGFPVAPEAVPAVGEGEVYHREAYDLRIVFPAFVTFLVLCFGFLRGRQKAAREAREAAALAATPAGSPGPARSADGTSLAGASIDAIPPLPADRSRPDGQLSGRPLVRGGTT
jgi:hypothetical protein